MSSAGSRPGEGEAGGAGLPCRQRSSGQSEAAGVMWLHVCTASGVKSAM